MITKEDKNQIVLLRKSVAKELKKMKITEPKFSVHFDYRTKKVKLCYSVSEDKGIDVKNNRVFRKKQKHLYLKNISLYDTEYLLVNLLRYVEEIERDIARAYKSIATEKDSLSYWAKVYIQPTPRRGNIVLSPQTIEGDGHSTRFLIEYLEQYEPKMMKVWEWESEGRDCMLRYMKHKQTVHKSPRTNRGWSDVSVQSNYRRLRAFLNWISENLEGFPPNILNRMPFTPTPTKMTTFTPQEIEKVKKFIMKENDSKEWGWFIPMFLLMLETGVRISELCNMKINEVEPTRKMWVFKGKGRHGGKTRQQQIPNSVWGMIKDDVVDEDGVLRTDKEYVFHSKWYRPYDVNKYPDLWAYVEDLQSPFTTDGFRNKFYKMVEYLKLNKDLSPHACRRYFITQMLIKTDGNIPKVAQLVGHSSWDMVKRYAQSVISEDEDTNLGLMS